MLIYSSQEFLHNCFSYISYCTLFHFLKYTEIVKTCRIRSISSIPWTSSHRESLVHDSSNVYHKTCRLLNFHSMYCYALYPFIFLSMQLNKPNMCNNLIELYSLIKRHSRDSCITPRWPCSSYFFHNSNETILLYKTMCASYVYMFLLLPLLVHLIR